jgi:hypothetical protein
MFGVRLEESYERRVFFCAGGEENFSTRTLHVAFGPATVHGAIRRSRMGIGPAAAVRRDETSSHKRMRNVVKLNHWPIQLGSLIPDPVEKRRQGENSTVVTMTFSTNYLIDVY